MNKIETLPELVETLRKLLSAGVDAGKHFSLIEHGELSTLLDVAEKAERLEERVKVLENVVHGALAWLCPDETTSFEGTIEDWEELARKALAGGKDGV